MKMFFEYLKGKLQGKSTVLVAKTVSGGLDLTQKILSLLQGEDIVRHAKSHEASLAGPCGTYGE
jgi:hypothetical protein